MWSKALTSQSPPQWHNTPSIKAPPKSATNWWLRVQIHELMGDYFSFKLPWQQGKRKKTEKLTRGMEQPALWNHSTAKLVEESWDTGSRAHSVQCLGVLPVFTEGRFTFCSLLALLRSKASSTVFSLSPPQPKRLEPDVFQSSDLFCFVMFSHETSWAKI